MLSASRKAKEYSIDGPSRSLDEFKVSTREISGIRKPLTLPICDTARIRLQTAPIHSCPPIRISFWSAVLLVFVPSFVLVMSSLLFPPLLVLLLVLLSFLIPFLVLSTMRVFFSFEGMPLR